MGDTNIYSFGIQNPLLQIHKEFAISGKICSKGRLASVAAVNAVKTVAYAALRTLEVIFYCLTLGHYKFRKDISVRVSTQLTSLTVQALFCFKPTMDKLTKSYCKANGLDATPILDSLEKDKKRYEEAYGKAGKVPGNDYVYTPQPIIETALNSLLADKEMWWLANQSTRESAVAAVLFATHCLSNGNEYRAKFVELSLASGNLGFLEGIDLSPYYSMYESYNKNSTVLSSHPALENMDERLLQAWESCRNESTKQKAMVLLRGVCFANNPKLNKAIDAYAKKPSTIAAVPALCTMVLEQGHIFKEKMRELLPKLNDPKNRKFMDSSSLKEVKHHNQQLNEVLNNLKDPLNTHQILDTLEKDKKRHDSAMEGRIYAGIPNTYVFAPGSFAQSSLNVLVADKEWRWLASRPNKKSAVTAVLFATENPYLDNGDDYRVQFLESSLASGDLTFLEEMVMSFYHWRWDCIGAASCPPAFKDKDERLTKAWEDCHNESVRQRAMVFFSAGCFQNNPKLVAAVKSYAKKPTTLAAVPTYCEWVQKLPAPMEEWKLRGAMCSLTHPTL